MIKNEIKLKMPNELSAIITNNNDNEYEVKYEIDYQGRGNNEFQVSGTYKSFELAIESIFLQIKQSE